MVFTENKAYRPFQYSWAVEAEKRHRIDMNWNENQIDLLDDLRQYNSAGGLATENVSHEANKNLLDKLLMLFTEMDVHVAGGYCKLLPHVKNNEIKTMWLTFAAREVTHQRGYALAAETFGFTDSSWVDFKSYKEMQDKIDLLVQDIGDLSIPLNFCKYLCVVFLGEGISLFGAFSCLLNLRRYAKLTGFNSVNEWSLKDEADHVEKNIRVFKEVRSSLSSSEFNELEDFFNLTVSKYVQAEHNFFDLIFEKGDQEGFTKKQAKEFITYLGELRKWQAGYVSKDDVPPNPIDWIDYILSAKTHTNFFESKVTDYSHKKLEGPVDYTKYLSALENRKYN